MQKHTKNLNVYLVKQVKSEADITVMQLPHFVLGQFSVLRDGTTNIENNTLIEIANVRSGALTLRCADSSGGNVTWLVLPENEQLLILDGSTKGTNVYEIAGSGSQIDLTIQNSISLFRGLLKCISTSSGVLNIHVVPQGKLHTHEFMCTYTVEPLNKSQARCGGFGSSLEVKCCKERVAYFYVFGLLGRLLFRNVTMSFPASDNF